MLKIRLIVITGCLISFIMGCSSQPFEIPSDGPTTDEVYENHIAGRYELTGTDSKNSPCRTRFFLIDDKDSEKGYKQYTEAKKVVPDNNYDCFKIDRPSFSPSKLSVPIRLNGNNELSNEFRLLPNPIYKIYVHSHFTSDGLPVPMYTSHWFLYDKIHYGKRGENYTSSSRP